MVSDSLRPHELQHARPPGPSPTPRVHSPITSWQIDGEIVETVADFIFLGSKITEYGDSNHEIKRPLLLGVGFPGGSDGKASVYNVGDPGSIPGLGRSPGEGKGNPLQDYCLENPMGRGAW